MENCTDKCTTSSIVTILYVDSSMDVADDEQKRVTERRG